LSFYILVSRVGLTSLWKLILMPYSSPEEESLLLVVIC